MLLREGDTCTWRNGGNESCDHCGRVSNASDSDTEHELFSLPCWGPIYTSFAIIN